MKRNFGCSALLGAVILSSLPGTAGGAGAEVPPPPQARREGTASLDQRAVSRMWRLTVVLDLDRASAASFFALLWQFDQRQRGLALERGELASQIRSEIEAKAPRDERLRQLVDRTVANGRQHRALEVERLESLRPLLTLEQQAKLLLVPTRLLRP